ncbi:ribokinase [Hyphobacterium sp. HN65]|uniref:Ribokinase n=1 Tax=Hyphobacterium lacteum TaxID=3116575 RepID=A0ABU7LSC4_9PROT|nr:ribokinase [Hyphobacterium sp. HN65]MEE2526792.1 ribokinase [Hyphobacterium sp. HN65]
MSAKICVAGSVNLDLVVRCGHLPVAGETVLGNGFAKYPGGKGANQALAARRLGADVSLIACVGKDEEADQALALLKADGVDLSMCRATEDAPTGVALIAVEPGGDNQIVVASGANACLSVDDLPDRIEGALIGQLETPLPVLDAALERCPGLSCVNLAPAIDVPDSLLGRIDVIAVNETEGAIYGLDRLHRSGGMTALTLGARGAVLLSDGQEIARAVPPHVEAVDATGAGDTFVAALTVALVEGAEPGKALDFACRAGALSTLTRGAQTSFPRRTDVDRMPSGAPHG